MSLQRYLVRSLTRVRADIQILEFQIKYEEKDKEVRQRRLDRRRKREQELVEKIKACIRL